MAWCGSGQAQGRGQGQGRAQCRALGAFHCGQGVSPPSPPSKLPSSTSGKPAPKNHRECLFCYWTHRTLGARFRHKSELAPALTRPTHNSGFPATWHVHPTVCAAYRSQMWAQSLRPPAGRTGCQGCQRILLRHLQAAIQLLQQQRHDPRGQPGA